MAITKKEVQHIAHLARLQLSDSEVTKFTKQLSTIMSYVEIVEKVSTDDTDITAQVTGLTNVMREDSVEKCDDATREKLLCAAPSVKNDHIRVKGVFQ